MLTSCRPTFHLADDLTSLLPLLHIRGIDDRNRTSRIRNHRSRTIRSRRSILRRRYLRIRWIIEPCRDEFSPWILRGNKVTCVACSRFVFVIYRTMCSVKIGYVPPSCVSILPFGVSSVKSLALANGMIGSAKPQI